MMELRKPFQFEAAHLLPLLCQNRINVAAFHGHSFKAEIVAADECDPKLGWLMDYADMTRAAQTIIGKAGPPLPQ